MNIHAYEKLWLIAALLLIVGFVATITYGAVGLGIAMVDDSEETLDPNALDEHERFGDLGVHQTGENQYDVNVRAYQFNYDPGTTAVHDPIVLPENSEVTFYVTSSDVIHSFSLVGTNVNSMVIPGEVSAMTVEFGDPDEYGILCNEYCGSGHHAMEGIVQVVPEEDFHLFSIESVDAHESVEPGDDLELTATVANDALAEETAAVDLEIGDETYENEVTVDAESTGTVTFTVDTGSLDTDDLEALDWTVTVESGSPATFDDGTESGSVDLEGQGEDETGTDDDGTATEDEEGDE
ncbi:cytochrome c oxidase subunit II [Natronosalvus vescus]|uniref:cytochrome c oxidase subunit II n=1 Tax=Natronosalvus vescus TaxID=2953881 RepID=UPI0020904428|nr:cytochrome c oxidase subunit II [Natronosalvus vescus]